MYNNFYNWSRKVAFWIAAWCLLAMAIPGVREYCGWSDGSLGLMLTAIICGCVLLDPYLQKLAFAEAVKEVEGISYEELVAKDDEQRQQRKQSQQRNS